MKYFILQLSIGTFVLSTVTASGLNSSCVTQCGNLCCNETERCSYRPSLLNGGFKCEPKNNKIFCSDGVSYCVEPATCCGAISCCPSNTVCCGSSTCCAMGSVCCGMSTCCPKNSECCGFSTCCSPGSRCVNGYCRAPWSSSMRWYYLVAVLIPFLFVLLYMAKRRQIRLAQQRSMLESARSTVRNTRVLDGSLPPPNSGYDPAPVMFEPPPYSEIANIPPEFLVPPHEKPPAYSELYNDNLPEYTPAQAESATGNKSNTVEDDNVNVSSENGIQLEDQSTGATVNTSTANEGPKP